MLTFNDFVSDRVKVCPHCQRTMMRQDFRGPCGGMNACAPKMVVPCFDDWMLMFSNYLAVMEAGG
jgi:hypothetical protein